MQRDRSEPNVGISVDEARARILAGVRALEARTLPLLGALGHILAEDIVADVALPPFDNSAMDGYAVRRSDIAGASPVAPATLQVLEDLPAGRVATRPVGPGEAIRIMTGAPVPGGADTVIKVEDTEPGDGVVRIFTDLPAGKNIRWAGEDVAVGDAVLHTGERLHAGAIGMLAALGHTEVRVIPAPVVAVISTGDELIEVGEALRPGKIRNSNAWSLAAQVTESGAVPRIMGIARDDEAELRGVISRALTADMIVTSGGVSVGARDLVKTILEELGVMLFWRVRQRPGKPLAFGVIDGTPLFGLPGNPTASMVSFEQYVRPAILKMSGRPDVPRRRVTVTVGEALEKRPGLRAFIPVVLTWEDGALVARRAGPQGSGMLRAMARAHGLLVLPEEVEHVAAGAPGIVEVLYPEDAPC
ncbi:MAG: gephyrin-like molybdotransferase Glp [Pseudomonadota bacterium]